MAVKPIPEGYHTVTPYLVVADAAVLLEFLKKAFGVEEKSCHRSPDGKVRHAEVQIGDSRVMMGSARDQWPAMPCMIYLYVNDTDSTYKQAIAAGATSLMEPSNMYYGDRNGGVQDPFGNQWFIATHVEDVSDEEMLKRAAAQPQPA